MQPAELYSRMKALVNDWPALDGRGKVEFATYEWLGRMHALIETVSGSDAIIFSVAMQSLGSTAHDSSVMQIKSIVHRALAKAEMAAPSAQHGAFIAVASPFDVFAELSKIVGDAKTSVRIVDPYLDAKTLTDVCTSVQNSVSIYLLGDSHRPQANLPPAVSRWQQQYGASKPLEARLSKSRALHDRLVICDDSVVWSLSQSIKDFAGRSPGSIERSNTEIAEQKVTAYQAIWDDATTI